MGGNAMSIVANPSDLAIAKELCASGELTETRIATLEESAPPVSIADGSANVPEMIRGAIETILHDKNKNVSQSERQAQIASAVVDGILKLGRFFYPRGEKNYASTLFFENKTKTLFSVKSDWFATWLANLTAVNRANPTFKAVTTAVEDAALNGAEFTPERYWAARPGAFYISNSESSIVKITAGNVETVDNGTDGVLFPNGSTLVPWNLCEGRDPFETCSLFRDVHATDTNWAMVVRIWIYSMPSCPASKPPLCLTGEIGSGKTRTAKGIAELWGLPFVARKADDNGENELWPALNAGGLVTLDNADTRCKWLPDALANAATDGAQQKRKLYTDADTVVLRANAWLAVTSSNPTFAGDAGLADRLLVVKLGRRAGETSDAALSVEIAENRNAGLSHIAWTLAHALANNAPIPTGLNARHPDFATLAVRIGRALGREDESIAALRAVEQEKASFCLENDNVGSAIVTAIERDGAFEGTAAGLLVRVKEIDPGLSGLSVKGLGKRLSNLWPHLEKRLECKRSKDRKSISTFTFSEMPGLPGLEVPFS
jgi:hypothetical protein